MAFAVIVREPGGGRRKRRKFRRIPMTSINESQHITPSQIDESEPNEQLFDDTLAINDTVINQDFIKYRMIGLIWIFWMIRCLKMKK